MKNIPVKPVLSKTIKLTVVFYLVAVTGIMLLVNACKKTAENISTTTSTMDANGNESGLLTVAAIRKSGDDKNVEVLFYEREQIFNLDADKDATTISKLQDALNAKQPVHAITNIYGPVLKEVSSPSYAQLVTYNGLMANNYTSSDKFSHTFLNTVNDPEIDKPTAIQLPPTGPGLTSVIPDLATAQIIFDYFAQQSCDLPGPYGTDFCISFQYTEDGCYARAHKMRWILENKYHYSCLKVFSFANSGSDHLGVVANKWGGCCITWWYHVAPLVTIKTASGNKSYVMDPAMFNTPVLLSAWLGAQQDKRCSATAHVSMYSIQPPTAYWPNNTAGTIFGTDPYYAQTDTTLVNYSHLKSCP